MEFKYFIFQALKVMEFNIRSLKVMEDLFHRLVTADEKAMTM